MTGLVSLSNPLKVEAEGPSDVIVAGGSYYVLMQDMNINAQGVNELGPQLATAGDLLATGAGRVKPRVIANLAVYEARHNPDHGAGPGARYGQPPIDSDPYAFLRYRGGWAVVDAAANDLLWVRRSGAISTLAVFPTQPEKLTNKERSALGAPPSLHALAVQSVPTSVTLGPDGALYVGELTGWPFRPGTARIWRVVPGHKATLYARGFTNISDLAFDGPNLLVLEIAQHGLLDSSSPGALIRLRPKRTKNRHREHRARRSDGPRGRERKDLHLELRDLPRERKESARRARHAPRLTRQLISDPLARGRAGGAEQLPISRPH